MKSLVIVTVGGVLLSVGAFLASSSSQLAGDDARDAQANTATGLDRELPSTPISGPECPDNFKCNAPCEEVPSTCTCEDLGISGCSGPGTFMIECNESVGETVHRIKCTECRDANGDLCPGMEIRLSCQTSCM